MSDDAEERGYIAGHRAAVMAMFEHFSRELGFCAVGQTFEAKCAELEGERLRAVAALRKLCAEFGDNDWPDDLHLADVIEKHLERQLREDEDGE